MAYTPTVWVNNSAPDLDQSNLNKIEAGIVAGVIQSTIPSQASSGAWTERPSAPSQASSGAWTERPSAPSQVSTGTWVPRFPRVGLVPSDALVPSDLLVPSG